MDDSQHILLVEDNLYDAELSVISLKRSNLANQIDIVRDGEEALDYLYHRGKYSAWPPINLGLILLDLKLPKIDGMEVLRQMKADPKLKQIPVIVLTGSSEDENEAESRALGVRAYLQKPIDLKSFHLAIRQLGMLWVTHTDLPPDILRLSSR